MNIPVRLYRRARDGAIVETLEPGESATLLYGQGAALPESLAESSGVAAYLRRRVVPAVDVQVNAKAVDQVEVEDKAVTQDEVEDKGVTLQDRARGRRALT